MTGQGAALVVRADARALPLPAASVDLIVTSPPYFALRSYTDGGEHYAGQLGCEATPALFIDALIACTREMVRVLKPSGSIWVNLGDKYNGYNGGRGDGRIQKNEPRPTLPSGSGLDAAAIPNKSLMGLPWRYAIRCIDELGLILRAEVVWSKTNGLPESVTDRVRRSHEAWFHFTVQPRYYSAIDELRTGSAAAPTKSRSWAERKAAGVSWTPGIGTRGTHLGEGQVPNSGMAAHPLGPLPGSVWEVVTQPLAVPPELGVNHFAAFPMEWPRRLILGWCPPDGRVLDPFGGTGTTALAAKSLGRVGITADRSADYCRIARWRTSDPGEIAKALKVKRPPPVLPGQASLFDGLAETNTHTQQKETANP